MNAASPKKGHDESTKTSLLGNDLGTLEEQQKKAQETGACLVVISGKPLGRIFPLKAGMSTIGRDPSNDIVIDDRFMSSSHGEFTLQQDRVLF